MADVAAYLQAQQAYAQQQTAGYLQAQQTAGYLQDQQVRAYQQAQQAHAQVPDLTPSENQNFTQQQTNLDQGYGQQSAQNAYARAGQQANHAASTDQLTQQFDQQRSALPGRYAHRGLLNSGVYDTGLQNYATSRTNAFNNSNRSYAQALGQGDLNDQQATQQYNSATGNLAAQKTARRADLASQLRAVQ